MKVLLIGLVMGITLNIGAQQKPIEVYSKQDSRKQGVYNFYAKNNLPGKYVLKVEFSTLLNLRINGYGTSYENTINPGERKIFSLKPENENASTSFRYSYSYLPGCKKTKTKNDFPYLVPLGPNREFTTVNITYLGEEMGIDPPKNFFSIGFKVQPNDTIFAARKGVVFDSYDKATIKESNTVRFKRDKNYIIIQHKDCTMARYTDLDELLVKSGQTVFPGQPIAIIGDSDYINGNHIKFSLYYYDVYPKIKAGQEIEDTHHIAYLQPQFLTSSGPVNLSGNNKYTSKYNDKIKQKEMSKKEKKKFKKGELF